MNYISVCSGIEAATIAWEPLGFNPVGFSEIEPFPGAVLAHHWPQVMNYGDMRRLPELVANDNAPAPDILVDGTPCQAFSVAGLRGGLSDERGALTLSFVRLANAIDDARTTRGKAPCVIVWENVPGVLNTKDNAFGHFLAGLAGEDNPLQPPGKKWAYAGVVLGPQRAVAWRTFDAQYFGLAQRRRRVFVIASARNGFDPAEVLFEREGVRRDSAPRRKAGEGAAHDVAQCLNASGRGVERVGEPRGQDPVVAVAFGAGNTSGPIDPAACLTAKGMRLDYEVETFLVQAVTGEITHALNSANNGKHSSEDGTGRGVPIAVTVALRGRDGGATAEVGGEVATAPRASSGGGDKPHVLTPYAVRRLMPHECERLQGFNDNHTLVPVGKKPAKDGPRYKAIGNSMAVPCMRWIGRRIAAQLRPANDNRSPAS